MTMKQVDFDSITKHISSYPPSTSLRSVFHGLRQKFEAHFPYDTLLSICLIQYQQQTKKTYPEKSRDEMVEKYFALYNEKASSEEATTEKSILLELAEQFEIPPALLARLMLRKYLLVQTDNSQQEETIHIKNELSRMMKNPFQIPDAKLSYEIRQCIMHDIGYGSVTDSIRHMVGLEYEDKLLACVKDLSIPYQEETELRKLGYDKTPDIKLEIPIAVDGKVVCWIESKASFGSPETHKQYLNDQYYSYWNRFGPGLVIYWFGFVDELAFEMQRQGILLMDKFPDLSLITHFDPKSIRPAKTL